MGTGISPIALALRDVGAGFGSILEQEARRRDQALQREVALGQLGVQQTQIETQGPVALARIGAESALAERTGRQAEAQLGLQERQFEAQQIQHIRQAALTGQGLDLQERGLGIQQQQANTAAAAQRSQADAQAAQARFANANAVQLEALNDQRQELVNVSAFIKALPPDAAVFGTTLAALMTPYGTADKAPKDGEGNIYQTRATFEPLVKMAQELYAATKKERVTESQAYEYATKSYAELPDTQKLTLPFADHLMMTRGLLFNPAALTAETVKIQQEFAPRKLREETEAFAKAFGRQPRRSNDKTKDDFELYINPKVAYAVQQAQRQVYYELGGGGSRAAAPPPPSPGLPQPAGGTPTPSAGAPAAGASSALAAQVNTLLTATATQYQLPPAVLHALADVENAGRDPRAVNQQYGAVSGIGPLQLTQRTFEAYGPRGGDIYNARDNIQAGAKYFQSLLQQYNGDLQRAYAAYNAGPGNVPASGPIPERVEFEVRGQRIVAYPRAFAAKAMVALQQRSGTGQGGAPSLAPRTTVEIPALRTPGLAGAAAQ